jgi:pimeloyl-ACP methyl ester carboxylesterase
MCKLVTPGATLQYLRTGTGPPVLLIQGVGAVGEAWRPQVDGLGDRFSLIFFDNRGIGGSEARDGRVTIDEMAADALAIVDAEGIDRFHVAGHSMGGVIAQAVALRATARVKSLAFLCTFAHGRDGARVTLPILLTALRMRIGTRAMRRNAFLELMRGLLNAPATLVSKASTARLKSAPRASVAATRSCSNSRRQDPNCRMSGLLTSQLFSQS